MKKNLGQQVSMESRHGGSDELCCIERWAVSQEVYIEARGLEAVQAIWRQT